MLRELTLINSTLPRPLVRHCLFSLHPTPRISGYQCSEFVHHSNKSSSVSICLFGSLSTRVGPALETVRLVACENMYHSPLLLWVICLGIET